MDSADARRVLGVTTRPACVIESDARDSVPAWRVPGMLVSNSLVDTGDGSAAMLRKMIIIPFKMDPQTQHEAKEVN